MERGAAGLSILLASLKHMLLLLLLLLLLLSQPHAAAIDTDHM
jgi:hypothetical protein